MGGGNDVSLGVYDTLCDGGGEWRVVYAEPDGWGVSIAKLVTRFDFLAWCPSEY
jgi:hypothetical protein